MLFPDWRSRIAFYLDDLETPIGKAVSLGLACLVLVSAAIFVSESYGVSGELRSVLDVCDRVILIIFTLEYGLRFWCAERKFRYVFSVYSIIDLVAIVPFLINNANVGFFRILRCFRILKLVRFLGGTTIFGYVTSEDAAIFARIIFTLVSIIFVYAGLIYQVEHPINTEFKTFLDAIYFCVSTITTAGFGDITPISQLGRLLTVAASLTGVVLIPWQIGDLIRQLVKTKDGTDTTNPTNTTNLTNPTNTTKVNPCDRCGWDLHDEDARFCKHCGNPLRTLTTPQIATPEIVIQKTPLQSEQ